MRAASRTATARGATATAPGAIETAPGATATALTIAKTALATAAAAALVMTAALGILGVAPAPVSGQSLMSSAGLGFPHESAGARAAGMGNPGIGLFGADLLPGDPAAARGILVPTITATYQPSWATYDFQGVAEEITASRFPFVGAAYPVGSTGTVVTLTFSSYLDQNWTVEEEGTLQLADGGTLRLVDRFRSEGGVSVLRLGAARRLTDEIGIALTAGTYLGEVRRGLVRTFSSKDTGETIGRFTRTSRWTFSGPSIVAGLGWTPSEFVTVGGSVTWSGDLHADPTAEGGSDRDYSMPLELRLGAMGQLSPDLFATVGMTYGDWSSTGAGAAGVAGEAGESGGALTVGGGLEWEGLTGLGRTFPLRVGYRRAEMPFHFQGGEPTETAFSAGLGLNLLVTPDIPLATMDVAYESGSREAGSFAEDFTRVTFTVRVAGP